MPRLSEQKQKLIKNGMALAKQREQQFANLVELIERPDPLSTKPTEANKITVIVKQMMKRGFNHYDVMNNYGKGAATSKNDTHSASRKWEKWLGGRGDGDPSPDLPSCEIKYTAVDERHLLTKANPVFNVGAIQPRHVRYTRFEDSSCYKKMENMSITSYDAKTHELVDSFVFRVDNPKWFKRAKEDYEFYLNELNSRIKLGIRSSASSIISSALKSPNGCLQVRSDSIMFSKKFFKEVSEYYE
jgi:hypothetical protein